MAEVILLAGAEAEALSIYSLLFERSEELANDFSSALDKALFDLKSFPAIGPKFAEPYRRKLVPGFYDFGMFYVIEGSRVMVHSIMNLRQSPEMIRRRLGLDP